MELGLASRLRPLKIGCAAAMLRVHAWECSCSGGIRWRTLAAALATARLQSDYLVRAVRWTSWLNSHMPSVVLQTVAVHSHKGINIKAARKDIGGVLIGPLTKPASRKFRRCSQRWFVSKMLQLDGYNVEVRLLLVFFVGDCPDSRAAWPGLSLHN